MSQGTLSEWPTVSYAGDTMLVQITNADYEADDGWTLTYQFRRYQGDDQQGSLISVDSTAAASPVSDHFFSVSSTTTGTWIPGDYAGICYASATGKRVQVWRGEWTLKPDWAAELDSYDPRSWAKRCLDKIESVLEGRASKEVLSSSIAGVSIGRLTPDQLFAMRDRFRQLYDEEQVALLSEHDKGTGKDIYIRFNSPA